MKSMTPQVTGEGLTIHLSLRSTSLSEVVLVLPDEVEVSETKFDETAFASVAEGRQSILSHGPGSEHAW
jgi:hypothetical protein